MAKATFIKAARKDIYVQGKLVEATHERGKNAGQKYWKRDRTQPADADDKILIHKGESYWTWAFMNGPQMYSKTAPRQSQLTRSEFMSTYYSIMEEVEDWNPEFQDGEDVLEEFIDTITEELEELRDETQDRLDNMPESLQDSDTGQLLQERIDECDSLIDDFGAIDTTPDYDEEATDEEKEEWWEDKVQEMKDICFNL